jgi:phosphate-selective porin
VVPRRAAGRCLAFALLAVAPATVWAQEAPATVEAQETAAPDAVTVPPESTEAPAFTWRWYWDQGLRYDVQVPFDEYWAGPDPEKVPLQKRLGFIGKIGGRLQVDAAAYGTARGLAPIDAGIEVRRLRFGTRGDFYLLAHASYAFDVDIVGTDFEPGDAYLWWTDVPWVQGVKIGNFTPSFSLESVTSTRDIVFMEPGLPVSAFGPARSAGIELGGPVLGERLTWSLGYARTLGSPDEGDRSTAPGRGFGRVTWLVEDDRAAARLTHLGLSGSLLFAADDVRYQTRPESHLAPYLVDTGTLRAADQSTSFGFELLHIRGPWLFMSETLGATVQGEGSASFWGTYALASRSLTGEPQPYDRTQGVLGRFEPATPFSWRNRTWGALRTSARVSHLDLSDGPVRGGRETNLMTDLTWTLDRYLLFKIEGGLGFIRDRPGDGNVFFVQTRLQIDFY